VNDLVCNVNNYRVEKLTSLRIVASNNVLATPRETMPQQTFIALLNTRAADDERATPSPHSNVDCFVNIHCQPRYYTTKYLYILVNVVETINNGRGAVVALRAYIDGCRRRPSSALCFWRLEWISNAQ
jgi:hypothetical protein